MSLFSRFLTPHYRAQLSYPLGKLCKGFIEELRARLTKKLKNSRKNQATTATFI
ncbi:MAG: hypothetical protein OFPII_33390 [Osedax symbiont Rs1]|nr:MAG: hypothetical protein OFPII_33390 [Osedax symbiont Rs1]